MDFLFLDYAIFQDLKVECNENYVNIDPANTKCVAAYELYEKQPKILEIGLPNHSWNSRTYRAVMQLQNLQDSPSGSSQVILWSLPLYEGNLTQHERIERNVNITRANAKRTKSYSSQNGSFDDDKHFATLARQRYSGDFRSGPTEGHIPTTNYYALEGSDYYYVELEDISVGDHRLHIPPDTFNAASNSDFFFDTGAHSPSLTTSAENGLNIFELVVERFAQHYNSHDLVRLPASRHRSAVRILLQEPTKFQRFSIDDVPFPRSRLHSRWQVYEDSISRIFLCRHY
ncbi:hypothetical protein Patl1_04286 [Pistacia atlantica]|uniref:Uncharacterized protein n=1 Tax=Pistacia atlantica TaxID=434234 RepID=A0ACC1BTH3_9ROSI|nr:hypothetical protein Patl1_04286 [Pistacia atlantica]